MSLGDELQAFVDVEQARVQAAQARAHARPVLSPYIDLEMLLLPMDAFAVLGAANSDAIPLRTPEAASQPLRQPQTQPLPLSLPLPQAQAQAQAQAHVETDKESKGESTGAGADRGDGLPHSFPGPRWGTLDASSFNTRVGPRYKKTGRKEPSGPALYEVVGAMHLTPGASMATPELGARRAGRSLTHLAAPGGGLRLPTAPDASATAPLPPLFVVNFMLPFEAPMSKGNAANDPGANFVYICRVTEAALEQLRAPPAQRSPALRLLAQYFERAARDSAMAARFKLIAKAVNSSELGIGSFLETYNGKPVLIKNGTIHRGDNYFELDVNVHTWGMLARKTLKKMQPQLKRTRAHVGFVIEGISDDELPEQILACCQLNDCNFLPAS